MDKYFSKEDQEIIDKARKLIGFQSDGEAEPEQQKPPEKKSKPKKSKKVKKSNVTAKPKSSIPREWKRCPKCTLAVPLKEFKDHKCQK